MHVPTITKTRATKLCLATSVVVAYWFTRFSESQFHEQVFQAWAFLHGHLYMWDGWSPEGVIFNNHAYLIHPPLAAAIMLPSVWMQGLDASQGAVCAILGAIGVLLAHRLIGNFWITVFFGFGTNFWYESILGSQWGLPLVASCIPTLLALIAIREAWSPYWVGLFAGMAFLARYDLALAWPVYLCLID